MSNEKQYPAPDEIKGELEQYLAGPEAEANAQKLNDAQVAKAKLQELGVDVPPQLQVQIDELEAKNPLNKIPKWATKNEWIKVLEARKGNFQAAIEALGQTKPAIRSELEAEIKRIDEKLTAPREDLAGLSQAEYANKTRKVLGLRDETEFSPEQKEELLKTLEARFKANEKLHSELLAEGGKKSWENVKASIEADEEALKSINEMEKAGHEPDVYNFDDKGFDVGSCSKESPKQRDCTYDESVEMRKAMGAKVKHMSPEQYKKELQTKDNFDSQSWSWLETDAATRKSGAALCGGRNRGDVDVGQAGANGHGGYLGWRGSLRVSWKNS